MHHYRQALLRMRQGDSDRDVARSGLMGRRTAASLRILASERGWLAAEQPTPDDATIAEGLTPTKLFGRILGYKTKSLTRPKDQNHLSASAPKSDSAKLWG